QKLNKFNLSLYRSEYCHLEDAEELRKNNATILIAFDGKKPVGMGAVKPLSEYAEIKRMYVDEGYRGTGLATRILGDLEKTALQKGYSLVRLETGSKHYAACKFYYRLGYYRILKFGQYPINDVSILMEKDLENPSLLPPSHSALRFNDCINQKDLDGLSSLLHEKHVFTDSKGQQIKGRQNCIKAWSGFFEAFPDYLNIFEELNTEGNTIRLKGYSVCSNPELAGNATWEAKIDTGKVLEWRVYDPS
ncbi:MAG: GNAT family N-acetyltransferase, partial [Owenweeksia sp.]